jgi:hypothetical protein
MTRPRQPAEMPERQRLANLFIGLREDVQEELSTAKWIVLVRPPLRDLFIRRSRLCREDVFAF